MNKRFGAVMFDLDGTLLPMDTPAFMTAYFSSLADFFSQNEYDAGDIMPALRQSTRAMLCNDGRCTNEEIFWETFFSLMGEDAKNTDWSFEPFYCGIFHELRAMVGENRKIRQTIEAARACADHVILATNSVFPKSGIAARLSWLGLEMSDFDLVTTFDNCHFCKPNPLYFTEILEKFHVAPQDAFMVGNDVEQDALAATTAGIDTFLILDCIITHDLPYDQYLQGNYDEMLALLKSFSK